MASVIYAGKEPLLSWRTCSTRKPWVCHDNGRDVYGRTLAHCFAGGQDIQAAMVRQGWAPAFRKYSLEYVGAEKEGIDARAGMWQGEFIEPWRWRHDKQARD